MHVIEPGLAKQVDIMMRAAKENDAKGAEQTKRESIRVARTTRELIKIFSAAYNAFREPWISLVMLQLAQRWTVQLHFLDH